MATRKGVAPEGYNTAMPYLRIRGAAEAIAFYRQAFGAKKRMVLTMSGRVGHAEIEIGGSVIMLSDEFPEMGIVGPKALNGTTVTMALQVADVDKSQAKAVAAGAKILMPAADQFYGYRMAKIEDPFGHEWILQREFEKVSPREMQKRLDAMMAGQSKSAPASKKGK